MAIWEFHLKMSKIQRVCDVQFEQTRFTCVVAVHLLSISWQMDGYNTDQCIFFLRKNIHMCWIHTFTPNNKECLLVRNFLDYWKCLVEMDFFLNSNRF